MKIFHTLRLSRKCNYQLHACSTNVPKNIVVSNVMDSMIVGKGHVQYKLLMCFAELEENKIKYNVMLVVYIMAIL